MPFRIVLAIFNPMVFFSSHLCMSLLVQCANFGPECLSRYVDDGKEKTSEVCQEDYWVKLYPYWKVHITFMVKCFNIGT